MFDRYDCCAVAGMLAWIPCFHPIENCSMSNIFDGSFQLESLLRFRHKKNRNLAFSNNIMLGFIEIVVCDHNVPVFIHTHTCGVDDIGFPEATVANTIGPSRSSNALMIDSGNTVILASSFFYAFFLMISRFCQVGNVDEKQVLPYDCTNDVI